MGLELVVPHVDRGRVDGNVDRAGLRLAVDNHRAGDLLNVPRHTDMPPK